MLRDEEENGGEREDDDVHPPTRSAMVSRRDGRGPCQHTTCPTVSPKLSELGQRGSESGAGSPGGDLSRRPPERCYARHPHALREASILSLGHLRDGIGFAE